MPHLIQELNAFPLAGLMLVVAGGFSLGRLTWQGFGLGPAGGTVLVALVFGALGLSFEEMYGTAHPRLTLGDLGFALFIYSVGFEAGPRFFSAFRGGPGWRFVFLGSAVVLVALAVAVALGHLFGLGEAVTAGVLAGALTSAPTYAAAAEVCADPSVLAVSFAITYPIGLAGVILLIEFVPRLMRDDLTLPEEDQVAPGSGRQPRGEVELVRSFRVENEDAVGRTLAELNLTNRTGCYVTRLLRGDFFTVPGAATRLEPEDHLLVKGRLDELREFSRLVGPEIYDEDLRSRMPPPRRVLVASPRFVGKSLGEIGMPQRHACLVTGVDRGGVPLEPGADLVLVRGDVLDVVGRRECVRAVAEEMGRFEHSSQETDIAIYAGGIFFGLLLGGLEIPGIGFEFKVGTAGGLLLVGVLLGRFRRIGPLSANVPEPARQLVRDLGILLFVAEAGVVAGGSSFTGGTGAVIPLALAASLLVTAVPVVAAVLLGRKILKVGAVETWGSVCGGMTSSSALLAIRRAADSNAPALSYAAAYAVASVLVTVVGQVVVFLM